LVHPVVHHIRSRVPGSGCPGSGEPGEAGAPTTQRGAGS